MKKAGNRTEKIPSGIVFTFDIPVIPHPAKEMNSEKDPRSDPRYNTCVPEGPTRLAFHLIGLWSQNLGGWRLRLAGDVKGQVPAADRTDTVL
jgi:hypothetical protein